MQITAEQARAELARRELAKRGVFSKPVMPRERTAKDFILDAGGGPLFLAGGGRDPEETLPLVGQSMGGLIPGAGFAGSVGGATAGQAVRQGIKAIRGTRNSQPRPLFGMGPKMPGIVNDLAGEAAGTATGEAVFRGGGKVIPKAANRMMNSVLKPARDVLERSPKLGLEAAEAGITGSKQGMYKKAGEILTKSEDALSGLIKNSKGEVNVLDIAASLDDLKRPYANIGDDAALKSIDALQEMLLNKSKSGKISVQEANQLKRDFYKVLKDRNFGTSEVPATTAARKSVAGQLRRGIEKVVPEAGPLNKKMGTAVKVQKALDAQIAQGQKRVLMPKLAAGGAGLSMMMGNPALAGSIMVSDLAVEAARSAPFVSGMAKNLLRGKKAGRPLTLLAAEMGRRINRQ